jgi:hypothetical protein
MMKQMSCKDLDLAYRELSKVSYSTLARPVPDWFYDDVKDAVFTRKFPKAVQSLRRDALFCEDKSAWISAGWTLSCRCCTLQR